VENDSIQEKGAREGPRHSQPRGSKSSFSMALIRTTRRWIPASSSTNQRPEKGDLITALRAGGSHPSEGCLTINLTVTQHSEPPVGNDGRIREKKEQFKRFQGLLPERQGQSLSLTVLYVPCWLDSGGGRDPSDGGSQSVW